MSQTLLNTATPEIEAPEAADSRFFVASKPEVVQFNPFYRFSSEFLMMNEDLLSQGHGIVFQARVTDDGEISGPQDENRSPESAIATISFDARESKKEGYKWHLIYAPSYTGPGVVETSQLAVLPAETVIQYHNPTNERAFSTRVPDEDVRLLLGSSYFRESAKALRNKKNNAQAEINRFWMQNVSRYSEQKFTEEFGDKEKRIKAIGFSALTMQDLPADRPELAIPPYQAPLFDRNPDSWSQYP